MEPCGSQSGISKWAENAVITEQDYGAKEELVRISYESVFNVLAAEVDRVIDHILSKAEVSVARVTGCPLTPPRLFEQVKNKKLGITGCMYVDRKTMEVRQVLEGSRRSVAALYKVIKSDRRHFVYREEPPERIRSRKFEDWGMQSVEKLEMPDYMVENPELRPPTNPNTVLDVVTDSVYEGFGPEPEIPVV